MKQHIYPFFSYIKYWLYHEDQYSLQSPAIYKIYTELLSFIKERKAVDLDLEEIRKTLLKDQDILSIADFGAGSKKLKSNERKTGEVTKHSTSGRKFSQLYQYFIRLTPANQVLELGTCTGINARYLSRATKRDFHTFEGSEALWRKAQELPTDSNSNYILGKIEETLPEVLDKIKSVDFALIDATHTSAGTMTYYNLLLPYLHEKSILAIADIHWSTGMYQAWQEIRKHPAVSMDLDFFEAGILFFDKKLPKSSYILRL